MLKYFSTKTLMVLIWITVLFIGFGVPLVAANETGWERTPDRPNQWQKQIEGGTLMVMYGYGERPIFIFIKPCTTRNEFQSVSWTQGEDLARGHGCGGKRHYHMMGIKALEKRGGPLPQALLDELKRSKPKRATRP